MRYRKPSTHSETLGQFFTPPEIASLLAATLRRTPETLLELGAGKGALVEAVSTRFPGAHSTLVEVDPLLVAQLRRKFRGNRVIRENVLTGANRLPLDQDYAAVIGNPPYGEFAVTANDQVALRNQFPGCDRGGWVRQDLAFLHESWTRVAHGGEMALLLAAPIVSDRAFVEVRRWLLSQAGHVTAIELPELTFEGAEVGTYLLTVGHRGRGRRANSVMVDRYLGDGCYEGKMEISTQAAIDRMDYRYHAIRGTAGGRWDGATTLDSLGVHVVRGSRSHAQFSQKQIPHVHTSDFTVESARMRLERHVELGVQLAEAGDILVPRVGSRCLLREAMVVSGKRPISEAVYRIRAPKAQRTRVFDAIAGESGRLWRMAHARGSCAKHLTVHDLLRLPVSA